MNAVRPANRRRSALGIIHAFVARGYGPTLRNLVLIIHGLIHLLGFAKAFRFAELPQLTQPISPLVGVLWLDRESPLPRDSTLLSLPGRAGGGR